MSPMRFRKECSSQPMAKTCILSESVDCFLYLAQTEKDIEVLKAQIANLQRQLDAVAARRSQMLFATQGAA